MIRYFLNVRHSDNVSEIVRVARKNAHIESLPMTNDENQLIGIIRPAGLHRVLDSDVDPHLVFAEDIAIQASLTVSPNENLLEALHDFGTHDIETLPVESGEGDARHMIELLLLLLRADVMRCCREEMLRRR